MLFVHSSTPHKIQIQTLDHCWMQIKSWLKTGHYKTRVLQVATWEYAKLGSYQNVHMWIYLLCQLYPPPILTWVFTLCWLLIISIKLRLHYAWSFSWLRTWFVCCGICVASVFTSFLRVVGLCVLAVFADYNFLGTYNDEKIHNY